MDPSTNNIVNLHPERRANKKTSQVDQTATSPFFEPSKWNERPKTPADDEDAFAKPLRRDGRQTTLSFTSKGQLGTKAPLTNPIPRTDSRRVNLSEVAAETISLLPGLLATRPDVGKEGHLYSSAAVSQLTPSDPHPHLPLTTIRVIDADTIDAALTLPPPTLPNPKPPLILNMANALHAGGGFKHGALAQEEALCYRSSLFFTLKIKHYPLPDHSALYSPRVLVIRSSLSSGHALLDLRSPAQLPIISVISVAAVCLPELKSIPTGGNGSKTQTYAKPKDRELMREKMRIILRVAAREEHTQLVLGALGCGAFRNPSWEVAEMWRGVLGEQEFQGRWEDVLFAVMGAGTENFRVFDATLSGLLV